MGREQSSGGSIRVVENARSRLFRWSPSPKFLVAVFGVAVATVVPSSAKAWILPEHAEITTEGAKALSSEQLQVLQSLWDAARGTSSAFCPGLGRAPASEDGAVSCLGFAELPAIAADHSCTPGELLREMEHETWLRDVVEVGNVTERRLDEARSFSARINAWSRSNLLLERADTEYALRATSNNAHFALTAAPGEPLESYLPRTVEGDAPLNATAIYVTFHLSALRFAAAYADETGVGKAADARRAELARKVIWSEAFALHFLQDSFSSGHNVGIWGGPAMMKGTHDRYSVHGLPAHTWSGDAYSSYGDAHMTEEDLRRSGLAVATSLRDIADVLTNEEARIAIEQRWFPENADFIWSFDVCTAIDLGFTVPRETALHYGRPVWVQTINPYPGEDEAHMPRFRAEIGPFFAFGGGTDAAATWGGYFSEDSAARGSVNGLLFAGVGVGLEGAIGISSDGLMELGVGRRFASSQYEPGCSDCGVEDEDAVPSRVPTRSGFLFHYRAPYWLIPGDLLLVAPVLLAVDFTLYKSMAITAANGGVLGLQSVFLTPIGTVQFMLGREAKVILFNDDDPVLRFNGGDPDLASSYSLFEVNSVKIDAPIFEYQPVRSFSNALTSTISFQLGAALDIPSATDSRTGEEESPGLAYSVYLRLQLESRWYFGTQAP